MRPESWWWWGAARWAPGLAGSRPPALSGPPPASAEQGHLQRSRRPRPVPLLGLMRAEPGGGPPVPQGWAETTDLPAISGEALSSPGKCQQPGGSGTPPTLTPLTSGSFLLKPHCWGLRGAGVSRVWGSMSQPCLLPGPHTRVRDGRPVPGFSGPGRVDQPESRTPSRPPAVSLAGHVGTQCVFDSSVRLSEETRMIYLRPLCVEHPIKASRAERTPWVCGDRPTRSTQRPRRAGATEPQPVSLRGSQSPWGLRGAH